jgi:lambda family phage tail tape measure protein
MVDALKKLDADQEILSQQTSARNARDQAALKAFSQNVQDSLSLAQQGLDNQLAGIGLGSEARQRLQDDLKIRQDYQKQLERLSRDYANIANPTSGQTDNYNKETQILKDALAQRLSAQQDYYDRLKVYQADWTNGARAALQDYVADAGNIAGQTEHLFSDALHGIEDAFVEAATTGKFSFKSLADSIIADLARIVAKAYVVTPILAALGLSGDSKSSGISLGSSGSGGGGLSLGSVFSSARTAVDTLSSSFGKAVLQGWNGGDGPIAGLEGAFKNGADYISTTLTSAFNTGSQAAAGVLTDGVYNLSSNTAVATVNLETNAVTVGGQTVGTASDLTTTAASSSLESLSVALSYIQGVYTIFQSFQQYGLKGAAVAGGAAAAGAYIGSFFGPLGTAVGFGIGAIAGAFGADKLFGSGEKYPELSTSASGTFSAGKYSSKGWVSGWNDGEPKFGNSADAALDATVQKFTTSLGMIYSAFGSDASVSLSDTMRQRRTSGDYSSGYSATLDDGSQINIVQQHAGGDFVQGLQDNYDDVMGTLLAQSIIGSKSVPAYFKAQFQKFANDWDATAEDVVGTIEGIFTRFNGVNDAVAAIGVKTLKLDDTGMMASDSVLNLVASISDLDAASATAKDKVKALQDLVNTYYSAFTTQEEQFSDLTDRLKNNLGAFGLKLPDNRDAYRDMVKDIDLTTAAGQNLFATLMGLATAADAYYTEIKKRAMDSASNAYSALQRAVAAEQKSATDAYNTQVAALNDMAGTAEKSITDMTAISTSLSNALKALSGTSDDAVKMLRAQAQATLESALATARSGGALAGFDGLDDALSAVSSNNTDLYISLEEFNRDQGRTANVVAELNDLNGKQLTSAEKSLQAIQDQLALAKTAYDAQMAQYDAELAYGQAQLDALNGVDTSVKSVAAAVAAMNAAVVAALATLPRTGAGSAVANTPENNATLIDSIYQTVLGRDTSNDAGGAAYWAQMLNSGTLTYDQIAAAIANSAVSGGGTAADAANAGKYLGLPGYAKGTNSWDGSPALVGEFGPEIVSANSLGATTIYPAQRSRSLLAASGDESSQASNDTQSFREKIVKKVNEIARAVSFLDIWNSDGLPATRV